MCLIVCLFVSVFVYLLVCLCVCVFVCLCACVCRSVGRLFMCLFVCLLVFVFCLQRLHSYLSQSRKSQSNLKQPERSMCCNVFYSLLPAAVNVTSNGSRICTGLSGSGV